MRPKREIYGRWRAYVNFRLRGKSPKWWNNDFHGFSGRYYDVDKDYLFGFCFFNEKIFIKHMKNIKTYEKHIQNIWKTYWNMSLTCANLHPFGIEQRRKRYPRWSARHPYGPVNNASGSTSAIFVWKCSDNPTWSATWALLASILASTSAKLGPSWARFWPIWGKFRQSWTTWSNLQVRKTKIDRKLPDVYE